MSEQTPSEDAVRAAMGDQPPAAVDNDSEAVREELARQRGAQSTEAEGESDEASGAPAGP